MKKYLLTLASILAFAVTAAIAGDAAPAKEKDAKEKHECAACKEKGSMCDKCAAEAKKKAESEKKH